MFHKALHRRRWRHAMTLAEVLSAMLITGFVLAALASTMVSTLIVSADAERQVEATTVRNSVLEQVRALPYDITGLCATDPGYVSTYNGEDTVTMDSEQCDDPRVPEAQQTITEDGRDYQAELYITWADIDGDSEVDGKRLSVEVTYTAGSETSHTASSTVRTVATDPSTTCRYDIISAVVSPDAAELDKDTGEHLQTLEVTITTCGLSVDDSVTVTYPSLVVDASGTPTGTKSNTVSQVSFDGQTWRGEVLARSSVFPNGETEFLVTATDDDGSVEMREAVTFYGGPYDGSTSTTNNPPTADFTATCTDLTCHFDGNSSSDSEGPIDSYDWVTEDGATDNDVEMYHTFPAPGSYDVTLVVTDAQGTSDSLTRTASVSTASANDSPTAQFTYSCTDLSCTFDGNSSSDADGTINSYSWDFGDGSPTASGPTTSHMFPDGGTWQVTLVVGDDDGATNQQTQDVTVVAPVTGDVNVNSVVVSPNPICVDNRKYLSQDVTIRIDVENLQNAARDAVNVEYAHGPSMNFTETEPADPMPAGQNDIWELTLTAGSIRMDSKQTTSLTVTATRARDDSNHSLTLSNIEVNKC